MGKKCCYCQPRVVYYPPQRIVYQAPQPVYYQSARASQAIDPQITELKKSLPENFGLVNGQKYKDTSFYQVKINGDWHLAVMDNSKSSVYTMPFAKAQELLKSHKSLWNNGAYLHWQAAPKNLETQIKENENRIANAKPSIKPLDLKDEIIHNTENSQPTRTEPKNLRDEYSKSEIERDETGSREPIKPNLPQLNTITTTEADHFQISNPNFEQVKREPVQVMPEDTEITFADGYLEKIDREIDRPAPPELPKNIIEERPAPPEHIEEFPLIEDAFAKEPPKPISVKEMEWLGNKFNEGIEFVDGLGKKLKTFADEQQKKADLAHNNAEAEKAINDLITQERQQEKNNNFDKMWNQAERQQLPPESPKAIPPQPTTTAQAKVAMPTTKVEAKKEYTFTKLQPSTKQEFQIGKNSIQANGFIVNSQDAEDVSLGLVYPNTNKQFTAFRLSYDKDTKLIMLQSKNAPTHQQAWQETLKSEKEDFMSIKTDGEINFPVDADIRSYDLIKFLHNQKQESITKGLNQVLNQIKLELSPKGKLVKQSN